MRVSNPSWHLGQKDSLCMSAIKKIDYSANVSLSFFLDN